MSFCDVVLAPDGDAKKIGKANGDLTAWESCSINNLNMVNFVVLYEILTGQPTDDVMSGFETLWTDKKLITVERFPKALVDALAKVPKSDLAKVAERWSESEEIDGFYGTEELQPFLEELTALARKAGDASLLLCVAGL